MRFPILGLRSVSQFDEKGQEKGQSAHSGEGGPVTPFFEVPIVHLDEIQTPRAPTSIRGRVDAGDGRANLFSRVL